ncbi:MAG: iron-sulfur cluster repair di-iron protein [Desulfobulbus oligotrophicus]|nr:iron-sulfur cluster repair di-iron protein [Desulfobulbus oligotrophicus]
MEPSTLEKATVGEIVTADYRTAQVFTAHDIDFCCGGNIPLATICAEKGLDIDQIIQELQAVQQKSGERSPNYGAWSLSFLADYIVNTHHVYLKENDDQIVAYAQKTAAVHGKNHQELIEIAALFAKVAADMAIHLKEEEEVFFPAVKRAEAARTAGLAPDTTDQQIIRTSLTNLYQEHEEIGDAVHTIRHLAKNFAIPEDACNTFRVTYQKLMEFEEDLHKHVHLENNILFPKAAHL